MSVSIWSPDVISPYTSSVLKCKNIISLLTCLTDSKRVWVPFTLSSVYCNESENELSTWDWAAKWIIWVTFSSFKIYFIKLKSFISNIT